MSNCHNNLPLPATKTVANSAKYQYGHPGMYGTGKCTSTAPVIEQRSPFVPQKRKHFNPWAICITIFIPWLLFCLMYWTVSFFPHYKTPVVCYLVVLAGLCFVAMIAFLAFDAVKKQQEADAGVVKFVAANQGESHREPTWLIFLVATCLQAWAFGVCAGEMNFSRHTQPYYDVSDLQTYPSVDPSTMRGQQLMDAGRVMFTPGSKLDLSRAHAFKNLEDYCVAPIVSENDVRPVPTYDFWAVGVNCCSGNQIDFRCGEYNNPRASAGLRLMHGDQRSLFRLAVQQAEAAYNIKTEHPLFFHWMEDPIAEVNQYMDEGFKYFFIGVFAHFMMQLVLVSFACLVFTKMGAV